MAARGKGGGAMQMHVAVEARTHGLLLDLDRWKREREVAARDRAEKRARERDVVQGKRNDLIHLSMCGINLSVPELDRWAEDRDDDRMFALSMKAQWGAPKLPQGVLDELFGDPDYRTVCMAIWREGLLIANGKRRTRTDIHGHQTLALGVDSALNNMLHAVVRRYRIKHHLDRSGKRLSPSMRHPEINLSTSILEHGHERFAGLLPGR